MKAGLPHHAREGQELNDVALTKSTGAGSLDSLRSLGMTFQL